MGIAEVGKCGPRKWAGHQVGTPCCGDSPVLGGGICVALELRSLMWERTEEAVRSQDGLGGA